MPKSKLVILKFSKGDGKGFRVSIAEIDQDGFRKEYGEQSFVPGDALELSFPVDEDA